MRRLSFALVPLVVVVTAPAIINPNFTPKHLVEQAEVIVTGPVQATADASVWKLAGGTALKGKAAAEIVLDLSKCNKDHVDDVKKVLTANGKAPAVLFAGTMNEKKCGFLHLGGMWLGLGEAKDRWEVQGWDAQLGATYVGGTDKLIRMAKYLLADPDADVPVAAGIRWLSNCRLGQVKGDIGGMTAVEIGPSAASSGPSGQPAKLCLFLASTEGDKLYRPKKVDDEDNFEDVTAAAGLDSKSRRFTWLDLNGDGLADLVSYDGKAVSVRLGGKDGKFKPAEAGWTFPLEAECIGLCPLGVDGQPGVLVSTDDAPLLLWATDKGWRKVELPTGPAAQEASGQPSACIVADFNNDGFADILLPRERGGLLWKGKAPAAGSAPAGGLEPPAASPVCTGGGAGVSAVGDFDGDGFLDIFLSGSQRNTIWENDGKAAPSTGSAPAGFTEVFRLSGSVSYKCPSGCGDVKVVDLNHDGRADLCLVYPEADLLYHWNRGFRSFGEEGEVRLTAQAFEPGAAPAGQKTFAVGDFNADASLDLAVINTKGELFCYFNDKSDRPGMNLRLKKGAAGPITASCWAGDDKNPVCLGTAAVAGFSPAAYVSARYSGALVVKFRLPGKPEQSRKVTLEDKTVDVILGEDVPATGKK